MHNIFIRGFKTLGVNIINKSFLNWYTQSLGGMIGIIICIWSYLQGNMVVYGNILNNVDSVSFGGFLASYILVPLCITITLFGAIESYTLNPTLNNINKWLIIITTIIGFLGAKIYFIIPSIFILFKFYSTYIMVNKQEPTHEVDDIQKENINSKCELSRIRKVILNNKSDENIKIDEDTPKEHLFSNDKTITFVKNSNNNYIETRVSMAKELISKNADKNFICELTGLNLEQVEKIEQENN